MFPVSSLTSFIACSLLKLGNFARTISAPSLREKSAVAGQCLLDDVPCVVIGSFLDKYFSRRWRGGKFPRTSARRTK